MAKEVLSWILSQQLAQENENRSFIDLSCPDSNALRRKSDNKPTQVWRPAFAKDIDRIMYSPFYNRYTDKTQVFSLIRNDDVTRRSLHVQLVSRIARSIGRVLGLNLDLIEAIALGHDIGHTPFGHAGEQYLSEMYHAETGRYFNHNVHSVRVFDGIFPLNLTLDTLNGIITHNGEFEMHEYRPAPMDSFTEFDFMVESCYTDQRNIATILPSTLEGCLVRVCDIIAYLGKDRQDAERAKILTTSSVLGENGIGENNPEIINNLMVNIIEHSYGKPYIQMDEEHYLGLRETKRKNYEMIYHQKEVADKFYETVRPIVHSLYEVLLKDLRAGNKASPIFRHHIDFVTENHYASPIPYLDTEQNQIVVDYIASMTDDYCIELYRHLFPKSNLDLAYKGYFSENP